MATTAVNGNFFGGERLMPKEKAPLVKIDAARVRAFMDTIRALAPAKFIGEIDVDLEDLETRFELPESAHDQSRVQEHIENRTTIELLWAGMTVDGLGVAFLGGGEREGIQPDGRKVPGLGIIADPEREKTVLLPGKLCEGNAEDSWDSGWHQHSYMAADWKKGVSTYKPIDEWGASLSRGHYSVPLLQDPHFLYNGVLQTADILLGRSRTFSDIQATLGHQMVCLAGEKRGHPAYNFERQIKASDNVYTMPYEVLTTYVAPGN